MSRKLPVFEMPGIEEVEHVGIVFDIIRPASRLDEGLAFVITEIIDGGD